MPVDAWVARTAKGTDQINTLVIPPCVDILIDEPHGEDLSDDAYRLISDDGAYDRTIPRAEATPAPDHRVLVRFVGVVTTGTYTLYYLPAPGASVVIFEGVPYAELDDHGPSSAASESPEPFAPPRPQQPSLQSGDPLVLADVPEDKPDPLRERPDTMLA